MDLCEPGGGQGATHTDRKTCPCLCLRGSLMELSVFATERFFGGKRVSGFSIYVSAGLFLFIFLAL